MEQLSSQRQGQIVINNELEILVGWQPEPGNPTAESEVKSSPSYDKPSYIPNRSHSKQQPSVHMDTGNNTLHSDQILSGKYATRKSIESPFDQIIRGNQSPFNVVGLQQKLQ